MNSFRTHTQPPPRLWCDICDEHGTMILAEFPVLYNYQDYKFTPEEYEIWHRNVLTDVGRLDGPAVEPSVGHHVGLVQRIAGRQRVGGRAVPGLRQRARSRRGRRCARAPRGRRRTTTSTRAATSRKPDEGHLQPAIAELVRGGGRPHHHQHRIHELLRPPADAVGRRGRRDSGPDLAVAQIGAEHTEAMRRARLDGIWPYMYAGWTRTRLAARVRETGKGSAVWKGGYAAPQSAAWHSSLSPVLASLDLFDPNYRTGQEVTTDLLPHQRLLARCQDPRRSAADPECPEFIPEAKCFDNPVSKWSFDFALKADSVEKVPVTWKLPDEEGCYWLTARMTGVAGRPVLSQRFVRAIKPPVVPEELKQRDVRRAWQQRRGAAFFKSHGSAHIVAAWTACRRTRMWSSSGMPRTLTETRNATAKALDRFLRPRREDGCLGNVHPGTGRNCAT